MELVNIPVDAIAAAPANATGSDAYDKNRMISIVPRNAGVPTALRVTLVSLPSPHDHLNGTVLWVGEPQLVCENAGQGPDQPIADCGPAPGYPSLTFLTATLGCDPVFHDFGAEGLLHVYDETIIPRGVYRVQAITEAAYNTGVPAYSDPLDAYTVCLWGDTCLNCQVADEHCAPPNGTVDIVFDVAAMVDKFANKGPGAGIPNLALISARADFEPAVLDHKINVTDITLGVDAFGGDPYPLAVPDPACP
jgi:hypothetical protein